VVDLVFNVLGFVIAVTGILLVISADARRVTFIGALVGTALGFWLVAPLSLHRHHLYPETPGHWAVVVGFFTVVFLAWSMVLAAVTSWPLVVHRLIARSRSKVSPLSAALWTIVAVPSAYVVVAAAIELSFFSRLVSVSAFVTYGLMAAALAVICALVQRAAGRRRWELSWVTAVMLTGAVGLAGVGATFLRTPDSPRGGPAPAIPALLPRPEPARPLLVIGLDGGSWELLQPLIDQGRLPTFKTLASTVRGTVDALWPPYWSTPAWGAILTGHGAAEIGVHEDLAASAKGLPLFELPLSLDLALNPLFLVELGLIRANIIEPSPVPRPALQRPPVWERLSQAGVRTAVVRLPFTYPARNQADIVVSNRVVTDLWDAMGVEVGREEDLVHPSGDATLLAWFDDRFTVDEGPLNRILPNPGWSKPPDAVLDPSEVARKVYSIGQRMFAVTEHLIRTEPDLDVVMLHVTDLDNVSHAFWAYRFPDQFPLTRPAQADIDALGAVPDRYLEYLDAQVARLINSFSTPPNVLVVSDHGQEAASQATMTLWKGWHSPRGVFLAGGPDIKKRSADLSVSYFDIVPTMLDALNIPQPPDLPGRSVIRQAEFVSAASPD
jgi:hypothetical protein